MKTYSVNFSMPVHFNVEVEAENEDAAIEAAMDYASLTGYAGNGGTRKLVGVSDECVSIEAGECVLEGDGWKITASEV